MGAAFLALAIWLTIGGDPQETASDSTRKNSSRHATGYTKETARSTVRQTTKPSPLPRTNAVENYITATRRGLSRSQVTAIIKEIRLAYPEGNYPQPTTLETARKLRNRQIDIFINALAEGLSLSRQQRISMEQELHAQANQQFAQFSAKIGKPFSHNGKLYQVVNGSELNSLYSPLSWLEGVNIRELCQLTETQSHILWPENTSSFRSFSPNSRTDAVSHVMRDPRTGTVSTHAKDKAPNFSLATNILPLTPAQGASLRTLNRETKSPIPIDQQLQQSMKLSQAQLTVSLLLRPEPLKDLDKAITNSP